MGSRNLLPWLAMVMILVSLSNGDLEKDREKCGQSLMGLSTCLPYVSGQAKAPTMTCCTGVKPFLQTNKVCLCILVKDRNEPNLGVKFNATLALGLPDKCNSPTDIAECPKLMNLPANSPEAKIFEDYGKNAKTSNITTAAPPGNASNGKTGTGGDMKNDAGNWLGVEKIYGSLYIIIIIIMFLFQLV